MRSGGTWALRRVLVMGSPRERGVCTMNRHLCFAGGSPQRDVSESGRALFPAYRPARPEIHPGFLT